MGERLRFHARVGGQIVSVSATALSLIADAVGFTGGLNIPLPVIALGSFGMFLGFVYWQIWAQRSENEALRDARPVLEVEDVWDDGESTAYRDGRPLPVGQLRVRVVAKRRSAIVRAQMRLRGISKEGFQQEVILPDDFHVVWERSDSRSLHLAEGEAGRFFLVELYDSYLPLFQAYRFIGWGDEEPLGHFTQPWNGHEFPPPKIEASVTITTVPEMADGPIVRKYLLAGGQPEPML